MGIVPHDDLAATVLQENGNSVIEFTMPLRWSDQDLFGHVNNARIVTLMEEARIRWLNRIALDAGIDSFTCPKLVVNLTVDYAQPVSYGHVLMLRGDVSAIGGKSFRLRYRGFQSDTQCFVGATTLVPIEDGRSRAVTELERAYLERFLHSDV